MGLAYDYPIREGDEFTYHATGGFGSRDIHVRVIGFKRALILTVGVEDNIRRDVSRKRLDPWVG